MNCRALDSITRLFYDESEEQEVEQTPKCEFPDRALLNIFSRDLYDDGDDCSDVTWSWDYDGTKLHKSVAPIQLVEDADEQEEEHEEETHETAPNLQAQNEDKDFEEVADDIVSMMNKAFSAENEKIQNENNGVEKSADSFDAESGAEIIAESPDVDAAEIMPPASFDEESVAEFIAKSPDADVDEGVEVDVADHTTLASMSEEADGEAPSMAKVLDADATDDNQTVNTDPLDTTQDSNSSSSSEGTHDKDGIETQTASPPSTPDLAKYMSSLNTLKANLSTKGNQIEQLDTLVSWQSRKTCKLSDPRSNFDESVEVTAVEISLGNTNDRLEDERKAGAVPEIVSVASF